MQDEDDTLKLATRLFGENMEKELARMASEPGATQEIKDEYEKQKQMNKTLRAADMIEAMSQVVKAEANAFVEKGFSLYKQVAFIVNSGKPLPIASDTYKTIRRHCPTDEEVRNGLHRYYGKVNKKLGVKPLPDDLHEAFNTLMTVDLVKAHLKPKIPSGPIRKFVWWANNMPRMDRIATVAFVLWTIYVLIRTGGDFRFLGHEFDRWYDENIFVDWIVPPLFMFVGYKAYRRLNK